MVQPEEKGKNIMNMKAFINISTIIIIFTTVLSLFIYNVERVFRGGIDFFSCDSNGGDTTECFEEYKSLIKRNSEDSKRIITNLESMTFVGNKLFPFNFLVSIINRIT